MRLMLSKELNETHLESMKNEYLVKGEMQGNVKEQETRKKLFQILKYTLLYLGMIEKTEDGIKWTFYYNDYLLSKQ